MTNLQIRPAAPEEATILTDIARRSKAHWGYSQTLLDLWADELAVRPEDCDGESVWVLEYDGEIVGFGELLFDADTAILDDLWIDPARIGGGYGRRLFAHLRSQAEQRGATRLTIEADPYAAGFYERMGARIIGGNQSESVPGRVLPLMELILRPSENITINTDR